MQLHLLSTHYCSPVSRSAGHGKEKMYKNTCSLDFVPCLKETTPLQRCCVAFCTHGLNSAEIDAAGK
jgi:hypothetical protein